MCRRTLVLALLNVFATNGLIMWGGGKALHSIPPLHALALYTNTSCGQYL